MSPIIQVENLSKTYVVKRGPMSVRKEHVRAVDGVSFTVEPGEVFGIVGESGSGKSTLGRILARLEDPTGGRILFEGEDIAGFGARERKNLHKQLQMVFQDPYASLDPRMSVREILAEPLAIHGLSRGRRATDQRVVSLLTSVGLDRWHAQRYPHEFSGGQRQRIGIARSLAVEPRCIIADEPVSALDVSVQAEIINLLLDLRERLNLTYLFIAHDLNVVEFVSDRIGVMYLGRFVEIASKRALYDRPLHPYTKALLASSPAADPRVKPERIPLTGSIPSASAIPPGCRFHTRCPLATERCRTEEPALREAGDGHVVACHLAE